MKEQIVRWTSTSAAAILATMEALVGTRWACSSVNACSDTRVTHVK